MLRKRPCRFLWQCWLSQTIVEALHKSSVLLFVCKKKKKPKNKKNHTCGCRRDCLVQLLEWVRTAQTVHFWSKGLVAQLPPTPLSPGAAGSAQPGWLWAFVQLQLCKSSALMR